MNKIVYVIFFIAVISTITVGGVSATHESGATDTSIYDWLIDDAENPVSIILTEDEEQHLYDQLERNPQLLFSGDLVDSDVIELLYLNQSSEEEFSDVEGSFSDNVDYRNIDYQLFRPVRGAEDVLSEVEDSDDDLKVYDFRELDNFDSDNLEFVENDNNDKTEVYYNIDDETRIQVDIFVTERGYTKDEYYVEEIESDIPDHQLEDISEVLENVNALLQQGKLGSLSDTSFDENPQDDVTVWNNITSENFENHKDAVEEDTIEGSLVPEHKVLHTEQMPRECQETEEICYITGLYIGIYSIDPSTWIHYERNRNSPQSEDNFEEYTVIVKNPPNQQEQVVHTFEESVVFNNENIIISDGVGKQQQIVEYQTQDGDRIEIDNISSEEVNASHYSSRNRQQVDAEERDNNTDEGLADRSTKFVNDSGTMNVLFDYNIQSFLENDEPDNPFNAEEVSTGDRRTIFSADRVEFEEFEVYGVGSGLNQRNPPCQSPSCKLDSEIVTQTDNSVRIDWEIPEEGRASELRGEKAQVVVEAKGKHRVDREIQVASVGCEDELSVTDSQELSSDNSSDNSYLTIISPTPGPGGGDGSGGDNGSNGEEEEEEEESCEEVVEWETVSENTIALNEVTLHDSMDVEVSKLQTDPEESVTAEKANIVGGGDSYRVEISAQSETMRPFKSEEGTQYYYEPWNEIRVGNSSVKSQWSYFTSRQKAWDDFYDVSFENNDLLESRLNGVWTGFAIPSATRPLTTHAYPEHEFYNYNESNVRIEPASQYGISEQKTPIYSPALQIHETCQQNWPHSEEEGVDYSEPCYWTHSSAGDSTVPPEFMDYVHEDIDRRNYDDYITEVGNYEALFQKLPSSKTGNRVVRWVYRTAGWSETPNRENVLYTGQYSQQSGVIFSTRESTDDPVEVESMVGEEVHEYEAETVQNVYETRINMEKIDQCGYTLDDQGVYNTPELNLNQGSPILGRGLAMECDNAGEDKIGYHSPDFSVFEITLEGLPLTKEEQEELSEEELEEEWIPINTNVREDEELYISGATQFREESGLEYDPETSFYYYIMPPNSSASYAFEPYNDAETTENGTEYVMVDQDTLDTQLRIEYDPAHWTTVNETDSMLFAYQPAVITPQGYQISDTDPWAVFWNNMSYLLIFFFMLYLVGQTILPDFLDFPVAKSIKEVIPGWIIPIGMFGLVMHFWFVSENPEELLFFLIIALFVFYKMNVYAKLEK